MPENKRIEVVDALRGFAILCIILLHNMEHFEFYAYPENLPVWLQNFDKNLVNFMYFLFGGKAYAIFAFIFGFSFFIQNENQKQQGKDFRLRFAIRLFWLLIFGFINTAFYQGDILVMYSILGLTLIPVVNLNNKTVFIIATILMLQPWEWANYLYIITHQNYIPAPVASSQYYEQIGNYMKNGGFWDYIWGDVTLGKTASTLWSWENGRFFQAPALFMFGMLAGRKQLFDNTDENELFWEKVLKIAAVLFIPLFSITIYLPDYVSNQGALTRLLVIFNSWANFALMLVLTSSFILVFYSYLIEKTLSNLVTFGKMALTNYIMQSIIGAIIYYRYGFGMYQYLDQSMSVLLGFGLFLTQVQFCKWWLKTHNQGPLEKLWHRLTWMKF